MSLHVQYISARLLYIFKIVPGIIMICHTVYPSFHITPLPKKVAKS